MIARGRRGRAEAELARELPTDIGNRIETRQCSAAGSRRCANHGRARQMGNARFVRPRLRGETRGRGTRTRPRKAYAQYCGIVVGGAGKQRVAWGSGFAWNTTNRSNPRRTLQHRSRTAGAGLRPERRTRSRPASYLSPRKAGRAGRPAAGRDANRTTSLATRMRRSRGGCAPTSPRVYGGRNCGPVGSTTAVGSVGRQCRSVGVSRARRWRRADARLFSKPRLISRPWRDGVFVRVLLQRRGFRQQLAKSIATGSREPSPPHDHERRRACARRPAGRTQSRRPAFRRPRDSAALRASRLDPQHIAERCRTVRRLGRTTALRPHPAFRCTFGNVTIGVDASVALDGRQRVSPYPVRGLQSRVIWSF